MGAEKKGNWWVWKVFWILLAVTTFEVLLGIEEQAEKNKKNKINNLFLKISIHIYNSLNKNHNKYSNEISK